MTSSKWTQKALEEALKISVPGGSVYVRLYTDKESTVTGLHPATEAILRYFEYEHLPPHLQDVSRLCAKLAYEMVDKGTGPELTIGLRKLLEAKDCFVRAALDK